MNQLLVRPCRKDAVAVPPEGGETFFHRFAWCAVRVAAAVTHQRWAGAEHLPRSGGVLVVSNHVSNFDPIALGHFLLAHGLYPRFIGKSEIWKVPVIGAIARGCGQIPVERNSSRRGDVVDAAVAAIQAGKCVIIYPEGTITGDPTGWPMTPRSGAARIALATGCPVIPIGQWGAQEVLGGKKLTWPHLFPRKTMHVVAGAPVSLEDLRGQEIDHALLDEAGDRIMDAITELVSDIRGEEPPATRYDLRTGTRKPH